MKNFPLLFCSVLFFAFAVSGQTNQSLSCPTIDVINDGTKAEPGKTLVFTTKIENYDSNKLSFDWITSHGDILQGQNTSSIKVLVNEKVETIAVSVQIKGLPEGCPATYAETSALICPVSVPQLVDEFGSIQNGEVQARIDSFYQYDLKNQPNAQGYIIIYGTDSEISLRLKLIKRQIALRRYDVSRITFVRGGANPTDAKEVWTKLWVVPQGAEVPTP